MTSSGLADSPFFAVPATPAEPPSSPGEQDLPEVKVPAEPSVASQQSRTQTSTQSGKHASMHAGIDANIIQVVRKAVKGVGRESATFRLTPEEKKALLELAFSYKVQGYRTSENEVARIAVNFILEDHQQNGRNSIVERVLQALSD